MKNIHGNDPTRCVYLRAMDNMSDNCEVIPPHDVYDLWMKTAMLHIPIMKYVEYHPDHAIC